MAERKMSRKWLAALGIDEDKIDVICEAHSDAMQALKDDRDSWQTKAEEAQGKLDKLDLTKDWKKLYENLVADNDKNALRAAKERALKAVYTDAGIAERYIGSLLRIADLDKLELTQDGKAKNHDKLVEAAKAENAYFIPKITKESAGAANPPANGAGTNTPKKTKAEIMEIADTGERQAALKQYILSQQKGS